MESYEEGLEKSARRDHPRPAKPHLRWSEKINRVEHSIRIRHEILDLPGSEGGSGPGKGGGGIADIL